jgi:Asp-tRNA(Asn)/Glu-tRNA(Gln) amidotransferase A subunit family amidase
MSHLQFSPRWLTVYPSSKRKQQERADRIANLPSSYHSPVNAQDRSILDKPIEELVQDVHKQVLKPIDILRTYGKVAVKAHEKTNCLTEVMIEAAEGWAEKDINTKGPLAGIPVSLKDSIAVAGFDTSVGYSRYTGTPYKEDGSMVKLLKDAGAIPYVKTALPITLLSFESTNDLWGRCTNPHNRDYSPGGSTGGEGALLALGGRIGIGSDVAGSVRAPAHFSGIYSLRCSTGRWPKMGMNTSMPGQEGIPSVFSPMARTLDDLTYFTKSMICMQPWKYDHSVHPLSWRDSASDAPTAPLKIGIMTTDGVVDPAPACARALDITTKALEALGHTCVPITPPPTATPAYGLQLASILLNADGCRTFLRPFRTGESTDPGAAQLSFYMSLPRPLKYLYYLYVRYIRGDPLWADLLKPWNPLTAAQQWTYVAKREAFKATWHAWWNDPSNAFDFLITPPNATPAVPHDGMNQAVSSCGYTFLFNLLDYTCGIVPVTKVDSAKDALPAGFGKTLRKMNGVARGAYGLYDAEKMQGLPVAVQVVGRRLEEEKVLAFMKVVEDALEKSGEKYELLEVD